jgi:hypothetical protein
MGFEDWAESTHARTQQAICGDRGIGGAATCICNVERLHSQLNRATGSFRVPQRGSKRLSPF